MRKYVSTIIVTCCLASTQAHAYPASDVAADHLYADAIAFVQNTGITEGYPDGTFRPEQFINRAEIVKILVMADGMTPEGTYCFPDVHIEWFAKYVCAARDHGMVHGYPDGMFRPAHPVTFVEAAALIVRAYESQVQEGHPWYMPYITKLQEWSGTPPTIDGMDLPVTREEVAYMIWRAEMATKRPSEPRPQPPQPEHDRLRLGIDVSKTDVKAGERVTYSIDIFNDGTRDRRVTISAFIDHRLEIVEAPGGTGIDAHVVRWNDAFVRAGGVRTLEVIAVVKRTARTGDRLTVRITADDLQEWSDIQITGALPYSSPIGDPVLYWNAVALQAVADDPTGIFGPPDQAGPTPSSRALAIVHAAIYDAVNSIDKSYERYRILVPVAEGDEPSLDAAVAVSAYKTLLSLYPAQSGVFDIALESHMSRVPANSARTAGAIIGDTVAMEILRERRHDGSTNDFTHTASTLPGKHREDPLNPDQSFLTPKWGEVTPFVLRSGTQFRTPAPPSITSAEYADAYNEVKRYGGDGIITPTDRTPEQTEIGIFWAYDGTKKIGTPPRMFNQIARIIATQEENTIVENARLFALVNLALADAGVTAWESKYAYDLWRPIVAIREADSGTGPSGLGDGNPLTTGDESWTPLGAPMSNMTMNNFTPPFPAYPSGHAAFGAAALRMIALFYGTDHIPFTIISDEFNGYTTDNKGVVRPRVSRSFQRLSDAAEENAQSRIYLGIHWKFDATSGIDMGNDIADYIFTNALEPVR